MKTIEEDDDRERRIDYNIVADCYGEEERSAGWYCYLEDSISFLTKAKCTEEKEVSPLRKGEEVEMIGMAKQIQILIY